MLLENRQSKIGYFIKYFLKFAESEFIYLLFETLYDERYKIPEIAHMGSDLEL